MNQVTFPLKLQMKREQVAHLHEALASLGFAILESEMVKTSATAHRPVPPCCDSRPHINFLPPARSTRPPLQPSITLSSTKAPCLRPQAAATRLAGHHRRNPTLNRSPSRRSCQTRRHLDP